MDELLEILNEIKPGVDFACRTDLFEAGILDSMTIVLLANEINEEFDVEIKVTDILPENFNSVEGMMKMIDRLQEED